MRLRADAQGRAEGEGRCRGQALRTFRRACRVRPERPLRFGSIVSAFVRRRREGPIPAEGDPMKFTLSWLRDHLDTDATAAQVVEAMTMAGLEVEHVTDPGEKLGAFSVAYIA